MRKIDALLTADTHDALVTKLEAFADHFVHLATTADQRELATEFSAFVEELIRGNVLPGHETDGPLAAGTKLESFSALHGHETLAGLFAEIRADEAARKLEDAQEHGSESLKNILDGSRETLAAEPAMRMDDNQRLAGFKAVVEDDQNSGYFFEGMDGSLQQWPELSPQSRLQYIAREAVLYEVPLQMVLHSEQELRGLEKLLPDDGRTESTPLVERFKEILTLHPEHAPTDKGENRDIGR